MNQLMVLILFVGGGLALIFLIIGVIVSARSERDAVSERLERYIDQERQAPEDVNQRKAVLTDWLNRRVERSTWGERVSRELARADLKLKPGEYVATMIITAFTMGLMVWYIGGQSIILTAAAALVGFFLPGFYIRRQQAKRLIRFNDQLADMLNLMVNSLRAGYSTMQAMESISKELAAPIGDEFRRVVQEMQLGISMEKALENLLRRIPSDDLDLVITAVNIQREVGGNLAEILDTISYTIRERVRVKGEIRVLTTQTMYSGRILSLMPIFVIGILYLLNREYMMEFFKPENNAVIPCGFIALGLAALLILVGFVTMTRLADIEL